MKFEPITDNSVSLSLLMRRAEALLALPMAAEGLDEHDFMQHGQALAEQLTGSQIAFIHFVNEDQETLSEAGIWADALRQRAPVVDNDYSIAPGKQGFPEGHAHLKRLISVPVIEGGLVRMMAGVGNKPEPYTERDVETVRLMADAIWRIVRQRRAEAALRQSEERHRLFADNASDVIWTMNFEGRFTYVSPSVEKLRGYTSAEAMQQTLAQTLKPESCLMAKEYLEATIAAMQAGCPFQDFRGELEQTCKDGSSIWVEVTTSGMKNSAGEYFGIQGVTRDITERKQAEVKINRLTQMYAALSRSSEAIVRSSNELALFPKICRSMVQVGSMRMAWIGLFDAESQCIKPAASFGHGAEHLSDIHISPAADNPYGQGPTATAVRDDAPQWYQDILHDPRTAFLHGWAAQFGWASAAALPLHQGGVVVGTFSIYASEVNAFDAEHCQLLMEMATNISFALDGFASEAARNRADQALRASEERNRAITQSAFDAIVTIDSADHIAGWNRGAQIIFGYTEQEAMGQPMTMLIPARFQAVHLAEMARMASGAAPGILGQTIELSGVRKSQEEFPLELTLAKWESADGWFVTGIIRDMTQSKANQMQLKLAAQVFAQGIEGIIVGDAQGNIVMVNAAFTTITGYTEAEVLGKNPHILTSGRHGPEFYAAMWEAIKTQGHWAGEIWNRRKDGTVYPEWLTISAMREALGDITHYVGNFSDLSTAKAAESRIQWLSHFDVLTGLPNRTLLQDRTGHAISMAQRTHQPLTMMMIGIDHFKNVNDTLGYHVGDELLLEMAKRLCVSLRDQDTVSRQGGKEFVLLLPDTHAGGAAHLAAELVRTLAKPYHLGDNEIALTVSIGIVGYPENGVDFDSLFKFSEVAMHRAQANGRNTFQFYSDELYQQVLARNHMIHALRQAIALNQLQLLYQPLVDLQTGQISGMEALLRWQHPELGAVSPVQFIPLAEESGLINGIGEWVLRQACRDVRRWLDQGIKVPHVAVNVSPLQFHDNDLIAQIASALADSQVDPSYIYIEVTESALMDNVPHSEAMLAELKNMGLKLSLDDFGTGYSSLSYLKRFPFDKVKIDQSFVRDITRNQSDLVLVKVIISMAHGLGLKVIAEGVETQAQCEIMRTSICDEIQGYFFSRPISAQAIEELFSEGRQLPAHLLRLKKPQRTLLLVDDEPNIVASLKRLFRRDGHLILTANSGAEGLSLLSQHKVDVIISDQRMPGMTGVDFLRVAKVNYPDTIRIVLSGYTELQSVTDAINEGAVYRFLTKPWEDEQLREHIKKAFEYKELLEENQQLDIKIRTTNQELVAANRQLGNALEKNRHQIERDRTSLTIVREVLQHIPLPVMGVDDEGLVAFVNDAAEQLFAAAGPVLGRELAHALPGIHAAVDTTQEGVSGELLIANTLYALKWNTMGARSASRGKIIMLRKIGPIHE